MIRLLWSLLLCLPLCADASDDCNGRLLNPLTDICWSCMLPISLGSSALTKSPLADPKNPTNPICVCPFKHIPLPGLAVGYWEPMGIMDVTRIPYCMVALGGLKLPFAHAARGFRGGATIHHSFYQVHWYRFPLLFLLGLMTDEHCASTGDWGMAFFSELLPTWQDDSLAFIVNPEAALYTSLAAQLACAVDAKQSTDKLPNDKLNWCAGALGTVFPLTGHVQAHVSGVQASALLAQRALLLLHRLKLIKDSSAKSGAALCRQHTSLKMPKSRYRTQILFPKVGRHPNLGATALGAKPSNWNHGFEYPYTGEDFSYLIFRKRNCCAF